MQTDAFTKQLLRYKQAIDADIATYSAHIRKTTRQQYGEYPEAVTEQYLDLLARGGKRVRGGLVICAYEMLGGKDRTMITRAALAIELLHAAVLIIDDIQDQDTVRRGKPAVHVALADYHRHLKLQGKAEHTGLSLALDASLAGVFAAHGLLAGLEADPQLRLNTLSIIDQTLVTTLHGQTYDVINAGLKHPKSADIDQAREWKSAHYTFLNPLCVGMVLAGAPCEDTDAIREYALHTGIAFQLADDIMDGDIAAKDITAAQKAAEEHVAQAQAALRAVKRPWGKPQIEFLHELAAFALERDA